VSFVTLVHKPQITLATNKLVFSAQELGAIDSVTETATQLAELFNDYEERIEREARNGYDEGFRKGQDEGRLAAQKKVAAQLLELGIKAEEQRQVMRDSVVELTLLAVHKIAGKIGAPEMVASMALNAVNDLVVSESFTLRVHPSVVDTVRSRLAPIDQSKHPYVEVQTDDTLTPFDCILVSERGETIASLDEQLGCLERSWRERLSDSENSPRLK